MGSLNLTSSQIGFDKTEMYDSRRTSYSSSRSASTVSNSSMTSEPDIRKTSLKEMPSYRVEASKALNRRDDLVDLHKRLSSNRDLLNADPATKPWLKFRSISQNGMNLEQVQEDATQAFQIDEVIPASKKDSFGSAPVSATHGFVSPAAVMSARPAKYSRSNDYDYRY